MRLTRDRNLAPTIEEKRLVARTAYEIGESRGLLAFGLADTHFHAQLGGTREEAGAFANHFEGSLRFKLRLPDPFEPVHIVPVGDVWYAQNNFRYVVRQPAHHGVVANDPLFEGTSLPDLLGIRLLGDKTLRLVRRTMPRLPTRELLGWMGLGWVDRLDGQGPLALDALAEAACSALALPDLAGNLPAHVEARRAAVHVGKAAGMPTIDIARALGVTTRAVRRYLHDDRNPMLERAILLQLEIRALVRVRDGAEPRGASDSRRVRSEAD